MTQLPSTRQQGAALLVALVMLLVLTVLTVTNMREVTLESRITANKAENARLHQTADAALRESEKRFYGPGNLQAKLEPDEANCVKNNVFTVPLNKPCLVDVSKGDTVSYEEAMKAFVLDPLTYFSATGRTTDAAANNVPLVWMPYRGTEAGSVSELDTRAYWNSALITSEGVNAEYGDAMEGRGTYFYLITGQAADTLAVQSTIANIYLGLNN